MYKHKKELFRCDICVYVTLTKGALVNHKKSKHGGVQPTCSLCGLTFKTRFDLLKHRRHHHKKQPVIQQDIEEEKLFDISGRLNSRDCDMSSLFLSSFYRRLIFTI